MLSRPTAVPIGSDLTGGSDSCGSGPFVYVWNNEPAVRLRRSGIRLDNFCHAGVLGFKLSS
jgi:hypothetical protein